MVSVVNYKDFKNLVIGRLNGKIYFSVVNGDITKYVFVPQTVKYTFTDQNITLEATTDLSVSLLKEFLNKLETLKGSVENVNFKKKLRLKGLGFRINTDLAKNEIVLKLGYSHLITLNIPDFITNVKVKKNLMLIESFDKVALGDFVKKVQDLRKADAYKGKGFSGQYDKKKLKVIKKK